MKIPTRIMAGKSGKPKHYVEKAAHDVLRNNSGCLELPNSRCQHSGQNPASLQTRALVAGTPRPL
jgi:hypothetical protein